MLKICKTHQRSILHLAVLTAIFPLVLAGCGGGSGSLSLAGGGAGGPLVSGAAVKGLINGATVRVYELTTAGTLGGVVGSGTTDASGKFSFHLDSTPTGPVAIVISGGSYKSETSGKTVTGTSEMCAMVVDLSMGRTGLSITPLSDMVCKRATTLAGLGTALAKSIGDADTFISGKFGLKAPPEGVEPIFTSTELKSSSDSGKLALILATLDALRDSGTLGSTGDDIYGALSKDYSDGLADGKDGGIGIPLGTGTLPFTALTTDFAGAFYKVPGSAFGDATLKPSDMATYGSGVTAGLGLDATSSGAISTLAVGGHQYIYVAARTKGVEKIDVTNPASPVVLGVADGWGGAALISKFAGSIGGAQIITGLVGGPQLLVFSYGAKHLALVNTTTGTVNWEGDLTLINGIVGFSGGSAYIAGAIPVSGQGAWLSTSDGYQFFDATATLLAGAGTPPVIAATTYPVATGQMLAENLGGDISHGLIFAPNYNGLQVINLTATTRFPVGSYTPDPAYILPGAAGFSLSNMDGGAVDSHLQVGIITYEDTPNATFIDLKNVVPGSVANTFAPAATNGFANVVIGGTFSGSAVDPNTDLALFMAGYSNSLAVGQLQDPASVAVGGTWNGMSDWVNYTLGSGSFAYSYATDPHAAAAVTISGKSYGYLLNGSTSPTGLVQIDMSALLAMPHTSHILAGDPTVAAASGVPAITNITLP